MNCSLTFAPDASTILSWEVQMKKNIMHHSEFKQININAAGIDIGSGTHYVAVPKGRDPQGQDVRSFGAFTSDLYALVDWLQQCQIDTVAMESTGVYWIALFELLESKKLDVKLINPLFIKNVPGRKTDVLDCQWIQQLHTYGLLHGSFRPADQICILRGYLRQRVMLISYASHHIQHIQKALEQMNVKLNKVIRDITGTTGMDIIRAIIAGERDPEKLSKLRNPRCKNDYKTIAKALHGNWRSEHLFALQQAVELFDFYQNKISDCDIEIERQLSEFDDRSNGQPLIGSRKSSGGNKLSFDARSYLYQMTGVDLTRIDGLDSLTVLKIISEIGLDMSCWPSEKHFASWLGLSPGSKISGGKVLSSKTKKCANRSAHYLRLAAYSLQKSNSAIGAFFRRKKAQLGPAKAVTATAHKIARIMYNMIKHGTEYKDLGQDYYERRYKNGVVENLKRRARQFGCELTVIKEQPQLL
jgi:transposase